MEVSGQLHALAALPPGKEPPVPIVQGLSGPHSQSRHCGEEKYLLPLPGIKNTMEWKIQTRGTKKPMLSIWTKQCLAETSYIVQISDIFCNILAEEPAFHFGFS
jgi:hypothetical protein